MPNIRWIPVTDLSALSCALVRRTEAENELTGALADTVREPGVPLDAIDQALAGPDAGLDLFGELTGSLVTGPRGHLRHEEEAVFPLVQAILSKEEREHFGRVHTQRIEADAARILPWLLDGVAEGRWPPSWRSACPNPRTTRTRTDGNPPARCSTGGVSGRPDGHLTPGEAVKEAIHGIAGHTADL
ncbi:hypothetical protein [Streptomyces sp. NPDC004284]|uniref:hypothetical protein n=1 Tax=Streptomyces sp. NPDC004284 TaxID=3364695 RepID=UPI0036BAD100